MPFEMGGVAIHPFEEALMVAGDGLASVVCLERTC